MKKRKPRQVTVSTVACKYDIVRACCTQLGFREVSEEDQWLLYWIDTGVSMERVLNMKPYQIINHFPGMHEICKKHNLARNLSKLGKLFPKEYNFWPKTWSVPVDYAEFVTSSRSRTKKNRIFIAKPESGCQGKGIFLFQNPQTVKGENNLIVQEYIRKPLLIDGFKFDLRVYVLVTSCDPLKVYVYEDGLARFATVKYVEASVSNMSDVCMHLTNYAINKKSENFVRQTNSNTGSKRNLKDLFSLLSSRGYKTKSIWPSIQDIIMKTLLTVTPSLCRIHQTCFPQSKNLDSSSRCFEILGFDVMLDRKMKPWVIEVNHSPSFTCDSPLDTQVKTGVIKDALQLLNLNANEPKRWMKEEKEKIRLRLLGDSKKGSPEHRNGKTTEIERKSVGKDKEDEIGTQLPFLDSPSHATMAPDKNLPQTKNEECGDVSNGDSSAHEIIAQVGTATGFAQTCNTGGYQQIYPCKDAKKMAKYEKILSAGSLLFSETVTTKTRREYLQKKLEESRNNDPLKKRPPLLNSIPSSSSPALSNPRRRLSGKPTTNHRGNSAPSSLASGLDLPNPGSRNTTASSSPTSTSCSPSLSTLTLSLFRSEVQKIPLRSLSIDRSSSRTLVNQPVVPCPVRVPHEKSLVESSNPTLTRYELVGPRHKSRPKRMSVNMAKSRHDEATRRHSFLRMLRNSTPHHNQGVPSNFQFGGKDHLYLATPHASTPTRWREPSQSALIKENVKAKMKSSLIYTSFSGSNLNWEPVSYVKPSPSP